MQLDGDHGVRAPRAPQHGRSRFGSGYDYGRGYGYPYYNPYSCYLPTY
jgi:hypothetical protein